MSLSDISIRRPVFAAMLVLGLVVLGLVSVGRLEMRLDPDLDFPFVQVMTELRGASPQTVEREVTDPLEEQLNSIEGIRTLSSLSSEGLSQVSIEFELSSDVDIKLQEVRDKVALARPLLPLDVEAPLVQKFDLNAIASTTVVLGGSISLRDLSDLAEHDVKERIERLPGVGSVTLIGAREREVRIWLDPLRLTGYDLSVQDVADTLHAENAELASGRIEGASREWSVTTQGKATSIDAFRDIIVAERQGRLVRLGDVAVVEDGMAEERSVARLNGRPGVALEIRQASGSSVVETARHVRAEVAAIATSLPPGVEISIAREYAVWIETQIREVFRDLVIAALLVVAVVLFFLRDVRSTLIASLAIPASVVSTFTFFYAFGLSINNTTLLALSLAIGLVIDDTIVVIESIHRKLEQGLPSLDAARDGSREVGLAVVATTLAVCAVFVPIAFMRSIVGRYFFEFGVAVTVAVCISTLVALTLAPMLASRLLRPASEPRGAFRVFERALGRLEQLYRRVLVVALRHKAVTLGLGAAAVVGGLLVASGLPLNLYSRDDMGEVAVQAKLPIGTPLAATDRAMHGMEELLRAQPFVRDVFVAAGSAVRHEPHIARATVMLVPKRERTEDIETTFGEFRSRLEALLPQAEIAVGHPAYGEGDAGFTSLVYSLRGPDLDRLERYSKQLLARMRADPDIVDAASSFESGKPQVTLEIDRGRAANLGVSSVAVGRTIRALLAGEKVGSFEELGRRYDVRVQVLPEYRDDPRKIDLVRVRSLRGELIPITNAAGVRVGEGPVEIRRENRTREIRLSGDMAPGVPLGDGAVKMEAWGAELDIQPPDELVAGGGARTMNETAEDIGFAFGLALIALYMVLASLFNSLTHPLTIMVSAPLSFIGGFVALALSGLSLDMMSGIGLLVLMGLVMKNGILLVDYTNQLCEAGVPRDEAVLRAGPVRMRPVLMTSLALVFGMLPAVLSEGVGSEFRRGMSVITIGGLVTSTVLTLVVVPVLYCVVDSATQRVQGLARRAHARIGGRRPAAEGKPG